MTDTVPLTDEIVRKFIIAAHTDLDSVRTMLNESPGLLRVEYDWGPGGREDGIGAAAHMGNRAIAEFFIAQGVTPPICALAMLGRADNVKAILATHPEQANARGAHGIPIMYHAALSGNVALAELLKNAGCTEGFNSALHGAVAFHHLEMVKWLLTNGVTDANTPDYENKTPLERAKESDQPQIVQMLQQFQAEGSG